ncbi:MAG TPA: CBS domain-containing protein [Candidatus Saccharimonadales bacterium]|nr:CBS domain-containing protein [Candidatus Saccharimonadales bacterium]
MKLVYILLALVLLKCAVLYKVYHSISVLELKRRARGRDSRAASLYKVAAYESTLDLLLWIFGTASAAVLVIWSARTDWWLAALVIIITSWLVVWTRFPAGGWAGRLAALMAPYHAWFLGLVEPVLGPIAKTLLPSARAHHTGLYEKKDLLEFLDRQHRQPDNRIEESDLRIAFGAVGFGDKNVGSMMTPKKQVRFVGSDETVGPMLMDELHKTGQSRFPVVKGSAKSAAPRIVGTLYLKDIVGYQGGGKVKELARKDVYYINEDSTLRQALAAFLKTHHHLLIVVNSFEEVVGVLSIENVMQQIFGQPVGDKFDSYDNLRAVAAQKETEPETDEPAAEPEPAG